MKVHYLIGLALLPLGAMAIEPGPSSPQQAETENWMALQINGRAASPTPQRAAPAEREQASQRWLDTYKHPIPEFFETGTSGDSKGGESQ
ncbi:DUF3613 domain-containing protein [Pseudomonas canadensis]|jgi:hypothetical protein|uniref:DUF3613 domain-containing protein n=1 Tax=Pseudomonas canadensis TaxID=915099 RepID=A0A423FK54_9PSED|nr:DUF3613 domain-containing protein [Pseudomonas canadensis]MEB2644756.1 DUF3613 domain-containing protein [Pseudomonas canadensis]ROM58344.1 hypothetical protein BK649_00185 [Pseudomonas canadensis]